MDEEGNAFPVSVEDADVQSGPEEGGMDADAGMDTAGEAVEEEGNILAEPVEGDMEVPAVAPAADATVSYTSSEESMAQIVAALLESDRVAGLMDSFEYTLYSLSDAVDALGTASETLSQAVQTLQATQATQTAQTEEKEPIVVISADDLLDRLEARQAETAQAAQTAVKSAPAATRGGELVVPGEEEIAVLDVVQAILSYFQEDDNDLLTAVRDNTASIMQTVTEIKEAVMPHALLETPFEDYSVTEGLLLLLVLWLMVLNPCIRMLKGGFLWLLS